MKTRIALAAFAPVVWGSTYVVTTELLPAGHPLFAGLLRALPAGLIALAITRTLPTGAWWARAAALGEGWVAEEAFFSALYSACRAPDSFRDAVLMAVNTDVPAKSVAEFIAYARENPGKLTFSSSGVGNPQQLTGELFNKMAGVKVRHVPYKGAAPQLAALAGKEVHMTFVSIGAAKPFIESQRIRPIGVTSLTRVSALPDVPAIAEHPPLAGFELVNFFGFYAPAGLPDPILKRLNAAAVQIMQMPELVAKFRSLGFEPSTNTPDEYRQFIRGESAKFATIIADAGLKLSE